MKGYSHKKVHYLNQIAVDSIGDVTVASEPGWYLWPMGEADPVGPFPTRREAEEA